jgi:hypothetical protein
MYWYKQQVYSLFIGVSIISTLYACKPAVKEDGGNAKYFDLKGYFDKDASRLTKLNKPVLKTVMHNNDAETKKVRIANWQTELSLFTESDINKPSWRDEYTIESDSSLLIYKAKTSDLKTQEVMIKKDGDKVKWIMIINHTKNLLYETREKLSYFPDSLYLIEKWQAVRVLGINRYKIKGLFNQ